MSYLSTVYSFLMTDWSRLPNAASLELLPIGDHHPRNRLLFLLIEALGYGERVGTGIPRILRVC
ncbi:hypothetical protein H8E77_28630 [bacterium]|nr:hypothetical protein [bacterium]